MNIVKQCLICDAPLGQESQDSDIRLCHNCRKCIICESSLKPVEVHTALLELSEILESSPLAKGKGHEEEIVILKTLIKHSRCAIRENNTPKIDPDVIVKQSYLNHLNNCRLICETDVTLSIPTNQRQGELGTTRHFTNLTLEEQIIFIAKMEAVIEHATALTKLNPKTIREKLQIREQEKAKKAQQQAETSSRPVSSHQNDEKEVILGEFMRRSGLVDRKTAKKLLKVRNDAINHMVALGADINEATKQIDADLVKQGRLKSA